MNSVIIPLFYLAIILVFGVIITGITNRLKISNILLLVLFGYGLKITHFNYFPDEFILSLAGLALILIVLETTMELDLSHVIKNFFTSLKFSIVHFFLTTYIITLVIFLFFDIPGGQFEVFVLCILLSILLYGVDPNIAMEFFKEKRNKVKELLQIEGIISGPVVVVFSLFIITNMSSTLQEGVFSSVLLIGKQIGVALLLGLFVAYVFYKFINEFSTSQELQALLIISLGILLFAMGELMGSNGSLAVAVYGLFLRTLLKKKIPESYTSVIAHILYIIVFVLIGIEFMLPSPILWLKGVIVFIIYLSLRFMTIILFMKDLTFGQQLFMTLNVAKGIEVALIMFIIKLNFQIEGLSTVLSLGFMFFIISYILSTIVNHYHKYFLEEGKHIDHSKSKYHLKI